jgi:hypothetical protein
MGTHLQEFSSYPSEVPTDYHKVASANPGIICETQHLVDGHNNYDYGQPQVFAMMASPQMTANFSNERR